MSAENESKNQKFIWVRQPRVVHIIVCNLIEMNNHCVVQLRVFDVIFLGLTKSIQFLEGVTC